MTAATPTLPMNGDWDAPRRVVESFDPGTPWYVLADALREAGLDDCADLMQEHRVWLRWEPEHWGDCLKAGNAGFRLYAADGRPLDTRDESAGWVAGWFAPVPTRWWPSGDASREAATPHAAARKILEEPR